MNDQDQINEEERQEAATETPALLGCPQHMPTHLPGGFDGVEPVKKSKSEVEVEELKKRGAKLKACNDRSYAKMVRIAELAKECVLKTTHSEYAPGQYGQDYRTFGKVMCEIRGLVGPGVLERLAALAPKDKPLDQTAPEMKAAKQKEYFRKHFSFCDGLFPIRFTNTEDGQMASCWINGRHFTLDIDNNERDDGGNDCAANIRDNGKVVITIETQRGKSISGKVAYGAFKEYVRNLSGSGKYSSRGGFLKQAAKRAKSAQEGGAK